MVNADAQIGKLVEAYRQAGIADKTTFIITSDHGMVPALHTVQISTIEKTITAAGASPLYVGHGDWSNIWLKNPSQTPQVAQALANANIPYVDAVFARSPTGRYTLVSSTGKLADPNVATAYSDLLASMNAAESADVVLLYDENTMTETPSFIKIGRKGDHGGATWGSQHIPMIISGPGVKPGYVSSYPARLVDIAPTLETLMGIRPRGQQGVPLADAMIKPPAWAQSAQSAVASRVTNDVHALENEAVLRPDGAR
jgi:arylsulfatase A-like enzyme